MVSPEEQVVNAVRALYHAQDPSQQAQANQWLTSFQQSDKAWQVPFALLAPDQPDEVQFFAATLLVRKVRLEWSKLEASSRQGLNQAIRAKFQEALGWHRVGELVMRQLCALLAAVSGASGGEGANELTTQALNLLHGSSGLALRLLTALAEEAEGLDRVRRLALVNVLMPRARELLGVLGTLLVTASQQLQQTDRGPEVLAVAALRCGEAWLQLNPVAGSGCCFSPGELHQQQLQLFGATLSLLACGGGDELTEAAVQLLLLVFGPEAFSADEGADLAATSALVQALLSCRARLANHGCSDTLPAGVAKLASAVAERSPDFVCGQMPEAAALAELMLEVLRRPGFAVTSHAVDYFLMVNTVPLAERPESLRASLYEVVVQRLLPHATYPPSFSSWEDEVELDEEAFNALRIQFLPELLEVAYGLLRMRYLTQAWQLLQGAASWQAAEVALFLLTAVSLSVKTRVLSGSNGSGDENSGAVSTSAAVAEDRMQTGSLLLALFGQLCSVEGRASMLNAHPLLAAATCRLVEHYCAWFGKAGEEALLQGAFQLLLRALPIAEASHVAAQAFQQLCLRCSWKLKDATAFGWLADAAHGALQQAGGSLPIADRQLVVEGLARVAAGLQGQQLLDAASLLTSPFLHQAQQAVAAAGDGGAEPSVAMRRSLADGLCLLASALRHLVPAGEEREGGGSQPAVQVLSQAQPMLQIVAQSSVWQADREVMGAVVEVYRRAVGTSRQHGLQLALAALPVISSLFAATALPGCLDVVAEALELQYEQPSMLQAATLAMVAACDAALPVLQGDGLREHPALVSSLLSLAHKCTVYAPAFLWSSPALPLLLQLATAAVQMREVDPVSHASEFMSKIVMTYDAADEEGVTKDHLEAVHTVLAAHGEAMIGALLAAVCSTCPRHLMRGAADCIRRLFIHPVLKQHAAGWLVAAAASGQLPGVQSGHLSAEDCATFASLAPRLQGPRFLALVVDFGLLAQGQNTSDVLLAYEL